MNPGLSDSRVQVLICEKEPLPTFLLNISAWFRTHCCAAEVRGGMTGAWRGWTPHWGWRGGQGWPASGPKKALGRQLKEHSESGAWLRVQPQHSTRRTKEGTSSITYVLRRCSHGYRLWCSLRIIHYPVSWFLSPLRGYVCSYNSGSLFYQFGVSDPITREWFVVFLLCMFSVLLTCPSSLFCW